MKYFLSASLCLFFLFQIPVMGQEDVKISKKEFKTGNDTGFNEAWKSIKEGNKYFNAGLGTYDLARDHFLFAEQYNPDNAELNYKIGVCQLFTGGRLEAIEYLLMAYELNSYVSSDIQLMLGLAYQQILEFDRAVDHYRQYKDQLGPEEQAAYSDFLAKKVSECQYGKELTQKPVRVIIQNLGEKINSKYDDYNPIFAYGDTALFFTSRRPYEKAKRNPIDNKYNEDIYIVPVIDDELGEAIRVRKPFNSSHNESIVGISPDGSKVLIYKGNINGGELLLAEYDREKSKWKNPKHVSSKLKSKFGETSACMTPDGSELYFISQDEKYTRGGKDILITHKDEKGKWMKPVNAGGILNTKYDEEGIYITPDGNTMYFSSRGHNSMGGFDIFKSVRNETGNWSEPENLGYPINTPGDEYFFVTDLDEMYGYYSAILDGGFGGHDLYRVLFLGSEKELLTASKDQLIAGLDYLKGGFLTLPSFLSLDTTLVVEGRVIDPKADTVAVLAKLTFIDPDDGTIDYTTMTGDSGSYVARLPKPKLYGVEINATGYLYFLDILDLTKQSGDEKIRKDFYLERVEVGTKVVLENIYFETGKAVLRPESFEALDQVYRFLDNNPTVKLEISGHTDNTGTLRINQRLSRERAKAVVDYLTGRGIPVERLVYEGYADTQPIASNDTVEGRTKNRRVEFKVLEK